MIEAIVIGRVGVDLTPASPARRWPRRTRSFGRSAGLPATSAPGWLGSASAPRSVSAVGDDGHGDHVRSFLSGEGIDVGSIVTMAGSRTQVAFFEVWPPDRFPVTFYRPSPRPRHA